LVLEVIGVAEAHPSVIGARPGATNLMHNSRPPKLHSKPIDTKSQQKGQDKESGQNVVLRRHLGDERVTSRIPIHVERHAPDRKEDQPNRKEQPKAIAEPEKRGLRVECGVPIAERPSVGQHNPYYGCTDSDQDGGSTPQ
jgi:hypothetical protein